MKISVIMPVYNCEKYLEAAIGSVLKNDACEIEIIAVDDASSDSSAALLKRIAESEPRVKAYFNEKNSGVAAVRNFALSKANGDYLAFCDSDDCVPEGAYAALIAAADGRDVAIGAFADVSDGGMKRVCIMHKSEKKELFKALFAVSCLWTKLIKRSFVMDNGLRFDEDMKIGEDVVFLARLFTCAPTYRTTDKVVYYHMHHEHASTPSLTHVYTLDSFRQHLECRRRHIEICKAYPGCKDYIYENFTEYLDRFLFFISDEKQRECAFREYREFMKGYPWERKRELFKALRGIEYDDFLSTTADGYIQHKYDTLPRDKVAYEFAAGKIGLRWIFKYYFAWLKYKLWKRR